MPVITYYNGQFMEEGKEAVPVEERGHQFGDGVYEVVRLYGGRPFLLDWHLERLERSLRLVRLDNPLTRTEWIHLIHEAIRRSGESEANVYFQVTRGIAPRNHLFPSTKPVVSLTIRPLPPSSSAHSGEKAAGRLLAWPDERWANAFVKSINLLPNVIAKEAAHQAGANEAMLVRNGFITECAGSNIWFVRNGALWTAPANRYILGGITRRFVLQLAEERGIPVHLESVTMDQLSTVDAVFITSTTQEILPIKEISVPASLQDALRSLPEDTPESLVEAQGEMIQLWANDSVATVVSSLQARYREKVQLLVDGQAVGRS